MMPLIVDAIHFLCLPMIHEELEYSQKSLKIKIWQLANKSFGFKYNLSTCDDAINYSLP